MTNGFFILYQIIMNNSKKLVFKKVGIQIMLNIKGKSLFYHLIKILVQLPQKQ